ncbi:MAG TPA: hypothetical protein VN937_25840 [Blastocatellia bacterium]|nr:hypothetical protein [Blastocatellia bacterium]
MKRVLIGCALTLALVAGVFAASSTPANFSGTWVLNKDKSDGLPRQLQNVESYTMVVTQDDKQLTVENKIAGGARGGDQNSASGENNAPRDRVGQGSGQGSSQDGSMTGGRRRGGFGGQVGGQDGGQGGGRRGGRGGMGMGMGTATYKLDGSESKVESAGGRGGAATLKAQWKDGGKVLELTNARTFNVQGNDMTRTVKDRWELADSGKTLKVKRSVDGMQGSQESTLVFSKQ